MRPTCSPTQCSQTQAPTAALPVLALLLLACGSDDAARRSEAQLGRSESAAATQPATSRPAPAPAVAPAEMNLSEEDIRSNVAHFDPSLSGWTTEAFHDHVKDGFKVLGHHFEKGVFDPAEYAGIVTQDAAIGLMRPAEPAITHSSPPVTVRRVGESAEGAGRGAEGLAAAVRGLRAPYEGLPAPRPAWKIIKVSLDGNRGHTYVSLSYSLHRLRGV